MQTAADIDSYTTSSRDAAHPLRLLRRQAATKKVGTPVLLLHGSTLPGSIAYQLTFGAKSWLADLSDRGFDAWSLDFRGYGNSWKPHDDGRRPCEPVADTAQAVEDLARAVEFIVKQTGARGVCLVGWSWGATVAATYCAGGGQIDRLVLHAPQWLRETRSPMVNDQTLNEPYREVDPVRFVTRWFDGFKPEQRSEMESWKTWFEETLLQYAPISVPNGSARDIAKYWMSGKPGYDPAAITTPTLVIVGAADTDTPPSLAREVFSRLNSRDKRYVEIPDGTHFTVFEPARDLLFEEVAAFLDDSID